MENILFILTDQWRADCVGYQGHKIVKTPNLDKLAEKSMNFTNSFTVCPLCTPARGSMFSGEYPHQSGIIDNCDLGVARQEYMPERAFTWLDGMVEAGYRTGYYGKWHLGPDWENYSRGMDFDLCRKEGNKETHMSPDLVAPVTERGQLKPGYQSKGKERISEREFLPFYGREETVVGRFEYKVTQKSLEFLEKNKEQPWCLTASLIGPHFPSILPDEYYNMYNPDEIELPASLKDQFINKPWFQGRNWWPSVVSEDLTEEEWKKTICAYYGCITLMDDFIGQILRKAEECSGGRPTKVIFTSDHGEMLGSHGKFDKNAYLYDEVIRTPLLICNDLLGEQKGIKCEEYCSTLDIAQTFYELAGYRCSNGVNLLKYSDETYQPEVPKEVFGNYYKYNGHSFEIRGIKTERFKYSFIPQDIDELYDLENDPYELVNLSDREEYLQIKEELKEKVFENMKKTGDYLSDILQQLPEAGIIREPKYPEIKMDYQIQKL